jgi:hypothetical protein
MCDLLDAVEAKLPELDENPQTQQMCAALKNVLPTLRAAAEFWDAGSCNGFSPKPLLDLLDHLRDFNSTLQQALD